MTLDPDFRVYDFLPPDVRDKVDEMFISTRNKKVWRIKTFNSTFTKKLYTYKEAITLAKKLLVGREVYYEKNLEHYAFKHVRIIKRKNNRRIPVYDDELVRLANAFSTCIPEVEQVINQLEIS